MRRGLRTLVCCLLLLGSGACAPESPTAFVKGSIKLSSDCVASATADTFWASGVYDIAPGGPNGSDLCDVPYRMMLLIHSFLRPGADADLGRAESNYLRVHSAEIKLMNLQRAPLGFVGEDAALPNPFLVPTGGVISPAASASEPASAAVPVEVIPVAYAPYLGMFVNNAIVAEIQLFGTTTGDVDIDFQPFTFTIDLCDGCLTICGDELAPNSTNPNAPTREDLAEGECDDNAGADGRFCVDPEC